MEQRHKDLIVSNIVQLINNTDLDALLPKLQERGVFPDVLLERYDNTKQIASTRAHNMYIDIQKRGPRAFNHLIDALNETIDKKGHRTIVQLLRHAYNYDPNSIGRPDGDVVDDTRTARQTHAHPFQLPVNVSCQNIDTERLNNIAESFPHDINLNEEPLTVVVKKKLKLFDNPVNKKITPYPMSSENRGALLLINNMNFLDNPSIYREGAEVDFKNVSELFKQCGFKNISPHKDLTYDEMRMTISEFVKDEEKLKRVDCCVVCIMSHGDEGFTSDSTNITTTDGRELETSWIINQFNSMHCPVLQNKPKIFIFQVCRGLISDYGSKRYRTRSDGGNVSNTRTRTFSDMLVAHSTIPGYASNRDIKLGTWYIQAVCKIFMEHACDTHVEDLLKLVDIEVGSLISEKGTMQTTSYQSIGFGHCFLHPGVFKNERGDPELFPDDGQIGALDAKKMNVFIHLIDKGLPVFAYFLETLHETGQLKKMQSLNSEFRQDEASANDVVDNLIVLNPNLLTYNYVSSDKQTDRVHLNRIKDSINGAVDVRSLQRRVDSVNRNLILKNANGLELPQIDGGSASKVNIRNSVSRLPDYYNKSDMNEILADLKEQLRIDVKPAIHFLDDPRSNFAPYPMRGNNRGTLLLINNIYVKGRDLRRGATVDGRNLRDLFSQLGFEIHSADNLSYKKLKKKIIAFTSLDNLALKNTNCCFVIVMSHGGHGKTVESSRVYSSNGKPLSIAWITEQFNAKNCPYLSGKPKVFLFQCCRGAKRDWRTDKQKPSEPMEIDSGPTTKCFTSVPIESDMLIGHSTIPGYVAHRSELYGSPYIENICKVFMKHAHNTDVERMLNLVCINMVYESSEKASRQISCYENRGFRLCFLHPKLYVK